MGRRRGRGHCRRPKSRPAPHLPSTPSYIPPPPSDSHRPPSTSDQHSDRPSLITRLFSGRTVPPSIPVRMVEAIADLCEDDPIVEAEIAGFLPFILINLIARHFTVARRIAGDLLLLRETGEQLPRRTPQDDGTPTEFWLLAGEDHFSAPRPTLLLTVGADGPSVMFLIHWELWIHGIPRPEPWIRDWIGAMMVSRVVPDVRQTSLTLGHHHRTTVSPELEVTLLYTMMMKKLSNMFVAVASSLPSPGAFLLAPNQIQPPVCLLQSIHPLLLRMARMPEWIHPESPGDCASPFTAYVRRPGDHDVLVDSPSAESLSMTMVSDLLLAPDWSWSEDSPPDSTQLPLPGAFCSLPGHLNGTTHRPHPATLGLAPGWMAVPWPPVGLSALYGLPTMFCFDR